MTIISGLGPLAGRAAVVRRRGAGGFQVIEGVAEEARLEAAPAVSLMPSLLAMQEAGLETVADRRARRHGGAMLDALGALQRALLGGAGGAELEALAALARSVPGAEDPRLAGVQRALLLRVAVEVARGRVAASV